MRVRVDRLGRSAAPSERAANTTERQNAHDRLRAAGSRLHPAQPRWRACRACVAPRLTGRPLLLSQGRHVGVNLQRSGLGGAPARSAPATAAVTNRAFLFEGPSAACQTPETLGFSSAATAGAVVRRRALGSHNHVGVHAVDIIDNPIGDYDTTVASGRTSRCPRLVGPSGVSPGRARVRRTAP